jgi:hypothetical protein
LKERGFKLKKHWFKVILSERSDQLSWGAWEAFYIPQKESVCWGVRDPDMSWSGVDMSTKGYWNLDLAPYMFGAGA